MVQMERLSGREEPSVSNSSQELRGMETRAAGQLGLLIITWEPNFTC